MARIRPRALGAHRAAALDLVGHRAVAHAEHLEPAGVGDDRPVPAHEGVQPAEARDQLVARIEEQVERVPQHHVVAERRDLGGEQALDGRLRGQRDEGRRADLAVGRAQDAGPGPGARVAVQDAQMAGHGAGHRRRGCRSGAAAPAGCVPLGLCSLPSIASGGTARPRGWRRGAACAPRAWGCAPRARPCRRSPTRSRGRRLRAASASGGTRRRSARCGGSPRRAPRARPCARPTRSGRRRRPRSRRRCSSRPAGRRAARSGRRPPRGPSRGPSGGRRRPARRRSAARRRTC